VYTVVLRVGGLKIDSNNEPPSRFLHRCLGRMRVAVPQNRCASEPQFNGGIAVKGSGAVRSLVCHVPEGESTAFLGAGGRLGTVNLIDSRFARN
jgi:hypothetical protein